MQKIKSLHKHICIFILTTEYTEGFYMIFNCIKCISISNPLNEKKNDKNNKNIIVYLRNMLERRFHWNSCYLSKNMK